MAPTILNTIPIVNPNTANGRSRSQTKPRIKNRPMANGQHKKNNIQKSSTAIKTFIAKKFFN